jgi:2-C-methyl-D-erythritol 4-phosphate cytidylyltransferase
LTDTEQTPRYWAVIPAAGSGSRMVAGIPKQYLPLNGQTVLEHALEVLLGCGHIHGVVLALSADDRHWQALKGRYEDRNLVCVTGGHARCHSVLNALSHLAAQADETDWVLVHDAARPCLRVEDVLALIDTLAADTDGGLLGTPVSDTMKRTLPDGEITETVNREHLWHAQTPQMFRLGPLRTALEQALAQDILVTDESAAMELAGYHPRVVCGHADNIKITVPEDLALAEFYLGQRKST